VSSSSTRPTPTDQRCPRTSSPTPSTPTPRAWSSLPRAASLEPAPVSGAVGRPEYLGQCLELSLRRLKVERIDLYQFHRIDPRTPLAESLGALAELQAQGKIRHIGVSNVSVDELSAARAVVEVASVQNRYNLTDRRAEDVLGACDRDGTAFVPWAPVGDGKLARPGGPLDDAARRHGVTISQLSLAWLLHRSPVVLPIPGTSSVAHLEENTAAAQVTLSDDEWAALESLV